MSYIYNLLTSWVQKSVRTSMRFKVWYFSWTETLFSCSLHSTAEINLFNWYDTNINSFKVSVTLATQITAFVSAVSSRYCKNRVLGGKTLVVLVETFRSCTWKKQQGLQYEGRFYLGNNFLIRLVLRVGNLPCNFKVTYLISESLKAATENKNIRREKLSNNLTVERSQCPSFAPKYEQLW